MSKLLPILGGLLLIAPAAHATLSISSAPTKHMSCVANTCTSTDQNAVLNEGELSAMLAGNDVTVETDGGAASIGIAAPLSWSSSHVLTLRALHDVVVRAPVVVEGLGGVVVSTRIGSGDEDGDLKFLPGGKID